MPEAEIAPTRGARTTVDRPVAVVSNVATTPALLMVHVDQLNRPVKMTDATGADVWSALYSPFGGAYGFGTGSKSAEPGTAAGLCGDCASEKRRSFFDSPLADNTTSLSRIDAIIHAPSIAPSA